MIISAIQTADRNVSKECYGDWPKFNQELCHYGQVHSGTGSLSSYTCACKAFSRILRAGREITSCFDARVTKYTST